MSATESIEKTSSVATPNVEERPPLTKKDISADHPTWCPGCGDFSILALYLKLIQQRGLHHEKVTTVAGIGCSSRFPYFVQAKYTMIGSVFTLFMKKLDRFSSPVYGLKYQIG